MFLTVVLLLDIICLVLCESNSTSVSDRLKEVCILQMMDHHQACGVFYDDDLTMKSAEEHCKSKNGKILEINISYRQLVTSKLSKRVYSSEFWVKSNFISSTDWFDSMSGKIHPDLIDFINHYPEIKSNILCGVLKISYGSLESQLHDCSDNKIEHICDKGNNQFIIGGGNYLNALKNCHYNKAKLFSLQNTADIKQFRETTFIKFENSRCSTVLGRFSGNICHFFIDSLFLNSTDAITACRKKEAVISMPKTDMDNTILNQLCEGKKCFIGIHLGEREKWFYNDESLVTNFTWSSGEPSLSANVGGTCTYFNGKTGKWNDIGCYNSGEFNVLCQFEEIKEKYLWNSFDEKSLNLEAISIDFPLTDQLSSNPPCLVMNGTKITTHPNWFFDYCDNRYSSACEFNKTDGKVSNLLITPVVYLKYKT